METPKDIAARIIANVQKVIIGKDQEVELALIALLCQGHALIEDVPGVGKTTLAKSISRSMGCTFKRIQFTPDLLPSDITGVSVYNQKTGTFEFRAGPVFAQIVLADEINRGTPKTQSALLEAMEERQVTVDGLTHKMPRPFLVLATQNPIEYEGTFPLPEAQLDRFLLRITLGYPSAADEVTIVQKQQITHPIDALDQVASPEELVELQDAIKKVYLDPILIQYIVSLVDATRSHSSVYLGASPRGSLSLSKAAQAHALLRGRAFVLPDDIKGLASPVLAHRIIIGAAARMKEVTVKQVVAEVLNNVPVPGARVQR
ncbi:MAG: MoxR family ATPase [Dehalococcoidia bacterium]|nr:MoxR family ATPase [Dehalococcoidia bacterium]